MTEEEKNKIKSLEHVHQRARTYGLAPAGAPDGSFRGMCPHGHGSQSGTCCRYLDDYFYCHQCKKSGDLIELVMVKEGVEFVEAVRLISRDHGFTCTLSYAAAAVSSPFDVLTVATKIFQSELNADFEMYRHFLEYGFTKETIEKHKLGYSPGVGLLSKLIAAGFTEQQCLQSGLFIKNKSSIFEFYNKRLIFPYLVGGKTRYMAGRSTTRTPQNEYEKDRKYKKLLTFDAKKRPYISKEVQNAVLFNSDAAKRADFVVVSEGIPDAISLDQLGIPAISPATTSFSKKDKTHVSALLSKEQTIFICNDNELNAAGEKGALSMARFLTEEGFSVRMMTIPLSPENRHARDEFKRVREQIEAFRSSRQA